MISLELSVADVLENWPETLPIFLAHRMGCIGCNLSSFDTLEVALMVHNLSASEVLDEMNRLVLQSSPED
jgi:hybrid cluster-associated redox disulfide protein